ncbi:MarR family winged helix-turn-helix transcriptional regulator [Microbacterium gorillae]|uniref:MarR family winged helix-turn-helix transcriptional regulator n=1 Tax=Microbacterium gorillae TaxID=1231063 RepID=UPI003D98773C
MAEDPRDEDRVDRILAEWRRERPDLDTTPQAVIGRLHRLAMILDRAIDDEFARFGISQGEFDVLATLRRAGSPYRRSAGELAEHTMISTGGLTKRVDRLIARGLVEREGDASDGRRRHIRLTPAGFELVERAVEGHTANEHRLISGLDGDAPHLAELLSRWLRALDVD